MLFKNVMAERDYTDENSPSDQLGHGTFVAGIVAGTNRRCPGLAPDAELYIYKVFGRNQVSSCLVVIIVSSWVISGIENQMVP